MKKSFFVLLGFVLVFAAIVLAWNLVNQKQVLTCSDTDNGLNKFVRGSAYGFNLNATAYNYTDYCRPDGINLIEFACNVTSNQTYVQAWEHNCNDNSTGMNTTICISGRCW